MKVGRSQTPCCHAAQSTGGQCPPGATAGPPDRNRHPPGPQAQGPGPLKAGRSLGPPALCSAAGNPRTPAGTPNPAFLCTGQSVRGKSHTRMQSVSTLNALAQTSSRPARPCETSLRCLPGGGANCATSTRSDLHTRVQMANQTFLLW